MWSSSLNRYVYLISKCTPAALLHDNNIKSNKITSLLIGDIVKHPKMSTCLSRIGHCDFQVSSRAANCIAKLSLLVVTRHFQQLLQSHQGQYVAAGIYCRLMLVVFHGQDDVTGDAKRFSNLVHGFANVRVFEHDSEIVFCLTFQLVDFRCNDCVRCSLI